MHVLPATHWTTGVNVKGGTHSLPPPLGLNIVLQLRPSPIMPCCQSLEGTLHHCLFLPCKFILRVRGVANDRENPEMKGACGGQACGSVLIKLLKWHAWAAVSRAMMSAGWTPISCECWEPWVHISCIFFLFVCFCRFFSWPEDLLGLNTQSETFHLSPLLLFYCVPTSRERSHNWRVDVARKGLV